MSSLIRFATPNFIENATTISVSGDVTAGYPVTRLHDRNKAREHRVSGGTAARHWTFSDLSAYGINALIIAGGHNIGGLAYTLKNGATSTPGTTVSSGTIDAGTGPIVAELSGSLSAAFWRFGLPDSTNANITEMFLTNIYNTTHMPDRESSYIGTHLNIENDETSGGSERWITNGPSRRVRKYVFLGAPAAEADAWKANVEALGYAKPFWICDHEGAWIFGNVTAVIEPQEVASIGEVCKNYTIEFREVI